MSVSHKLPKNSLRVGAVTAALACAAALAACGSTDEAENTGNAESRTTPLEQDAEQPLGSIEERGRDLFVANCGACHTLDAAGTQGTIGPDLNEALVDRDEALRAIERGGKGSGNMPAGLLSGADAEAVAAFVAGSGPGS